MSQPSLLATPEPWNLVAGPYTQELVPSFEAYARDALGFAAPARGVRVVDVACGPGSLSILAAQSGLNVDAIDFSPAMIEQLEARMKAAELTNIIPRVGDGQELPYADGRFAAGFSMFGLMFFPDRAKGFAELRRVLASHGRAVVASWTPLEDTPALFAMFSAMRSSMKMLMGDAAPQPGSQEMPLSTEDLCRAEMGAVFSDVEVHRVSHVQRFASADEFFGQLERTMAPLVVMKKTMGDAKFAPIADAARTAIREVVGDGEAEVTLTALISVGVAG